MKSKHFQSHLKLSKKADLIRRKFIYIYGYLYKPISITGLPYTCVYCGDFATVTDHVPPITKVNSYRDFKLPKEYYLIVPSCRECNSILSNSLQKSIIHRIFYCHKLLYKKYKKQIHGKIWNAEMLKYAELKGKLKTYVKGHSDLTKIQSDRVDFYKGLHSIMEQLDMDIEFFDDINL